MRSLSLRNILKYFLVFVLVFLLLEAALRVTGYLYLSRIHYNNFVNTHNPSPQDINIVCLGESSTNGLYVNWNDSYPMQLQRKLREFYKNNNIKIILPPHVGQNTSHMSNRIDSYLALYKPRLIILMVGSNNEWSFSESHVTKFLGLHRSTLYVHSIIFLDSFRLFKVLRYCYLTITRQEDSLFEAKKVKVLHGDPEFNRWPPKGWLWRFSSTHRNAFIKMWKYDVRRIIHAAKKKDSKVLLMTYAFPIYVPSDDFVSMAKEYDIPVVRNDLTFAPIVKAGEWDRYFCKDHWHPTKNGYTIISNNAFESIRKNDLLSLERPRNN